MKDTLFDTPEKVQKAIAAFTALQDHEGWKLVVAILNENIEFWRDRLEEGTGKEETREDINSIRNKLSIFKDIKNTPKKMIEQLRDKDDTFPEDDPYSTSEDVEKERNKRNSRA